MGDGGATPWVLALGLMLVFEGLLPLVAPGAWKEMVQRIAGFRDGQIRFVGLAAIAAGIIVIVVAQ
ncbi:MAG: DUF2065 domain-containing protein [Burkholderiaceae bacterium]